MLKVNYNEADEIETKDDISIYNIKESLKFKKVDCFELGCLSWLKNDIKRDFQDLEQTLRTLNINGYIIGKTLNEDIPEEYEFKMPFESSINDKDNKEYLALFFCGNNEEYENELKKNNLSSEENLINLSKSCCLLKKNSNIDDNTDNTNNSNKKIINSEVKVEFKNFTEKESLYLILEDLKDKYNETPEKIICGEINNKKVHCFSLNKEIISPIGWIEENEDDIKLIDFRTINIQKK